MEEAISLLNINFPSVLAENVSSTTLKHEDTRPKTISPVTSNLEYASSTSTEPAHLLLNVRILAFSEACRTIPLNYPPKTDSKDQDSVESAMDTASEPEIKEDSPNGQNSEHQLQLLMKAQKLFALTKILPNGADRATYYKELENVGGLLAYQVPEKSSISKYLTMERREAVADQINRAILSEPAFLVESFALT